MTRVNAFLVLILAFSSICFGATLMQRSMARSTTNSNTINESCEQIIQSQKLSQSNLAEELYKEAYALSFRGDWEAATNASKCAARLVNGTDHWKIELGNFLR